MLWFIFKQT